MKIDRRGAGRYAGTRTQRHHGTFAWSATEKAFVLRTRRVKDFTSSSIHNYDIAIEPDELAAMVGAAAEELRKGGESQDLVSALAPHLKSLMRLVHACVDGS
ncbi:MAG TPA: hypothetical protein VGM77_02085 [Gemmatimonadales bacterium]|jgi:hypothetical protein